MSVGDLAKRAGRWLAARSPITVLLAGWIVFVLGSYPGYLSIVSTLQLYTVRTGDTSDYAPLMTVIWQVLEYVVAGPFPMLVLQSGLFLFGTYGILRTGQSVPRPSGRGTETPDNVDPRRAAVTAVIVLVFPPVFAPLAVIWPDPLMSGAMLAGIAALLHGGRRMRIAAGACFILACSCRPEVGFALVPIAFLAVPKSVWWKRAGIALALVLGVAAFTRGADWAFTVRDNYEWRQNLMMADVVGTLRRAKVKDDQKLYVALAGVPLAADASTVKERVIARKDALDSWALLNGKEAIFTEIMDDDEAHNLARSWKHVVTQYPGAYLFHRWAITRAMIGLGSSFAPVFDEFGDPALLHPLHHRATVSDWQYGMQKIVRAFAATPIFKPWLYLILALAVLVIARRVVIIRTVVASGLIYMATMFFFAPSPEYRYVHWFIAATVVGLAAVIVGRIKRARDA